MSQTQSPKVKIGVVGCGVVATAYYLPYMMRMQDAEISAVCDLYATRTEACVRLFGAKEAYQDYYEMIEKADIDVVFILTAPGTHVPFTLAAIEAGKHVLIQKPMATNMEDAHTIADAVRAAGVKAIIEPSSNSSLDPDIAQLRQLVKAGVLGKILWFSLGSTGPTTYGPALGSNPYGQAAFFDKDSGGFLFDLPYAPANIVSVLGPCKNIMAHTGIGLTDHKIVPEEEYDKFLAQATDPDNANYWDVVVDLPRTKAVKMEAVDNAYSLYEMVDGSVGTCHVGRIFHPDAARRRTAAASRSSAPRATSSLAPATQPRSSRHARICCPTWTTTAGSTFPCAATAARPSGRSPRPAASTTTTSRPST